MKHPRLPALALTALLVSNAPVPALTQEPGVDLETSLQPALVQLMERFRLPGLALGVVKGDQVVYAHGFGEASRGSGRAITPQSIFHLASVSKLFTATAAMQLVEAGKLELDAPLTRTLPYFRLAEEESRTITLRQVLTHTSGFPDVRDYEWDKPQRDAGAAERYVRSLAGEHLMFPPGKGWRYSNMAFDVLADVIAKASGEPFEDYLRRHVFEPLAMTHTSFVPDETPAADRTQGHSMFYSQRVDQAPCPVYPYTRQHAPSSTLNSCVVDLCRWARANLARGELEGKRILREESYGLLWAKQDDASTFGLAWMLGDLGGRFTVSHSGSDVGYTSYLLLVPGESLGVVVMINSDDGPVGEIARAVALAALGERFALPRRPHIATEFAAVLESEGLEAASERYFELQETAPEAWVFGFRELDGVCAALLRRQRNALALEIAQLNADVYLDEGAALARWGQALAATGDAEGAHAKFVRALELDPSNALARAGLERTEPPADQ